MSNLINFDFNNSTVRTITDEHNEAWFVASDVCNILGYTNSRKAINDHCKAKGVTKRYTLTEKGEQELTYINEPNLYRLIIKSRKPEAEKFEEWVMEEVLPSIRKTGAYDTTLPATALSAMDITTLPRPTGVYPTKRFLAEVDKYGQMKMRELSDLEFVSTFEQLPFIIRHCDYTYQGNDKQMAAIAKAALNTITGEWE